MKRPRFGIFFTWFISYVVILSLLLVSAAALYVIADRSINAEVEQNLDLASQLLQSYIDNRLEDIEQSAFEIIFDEKVESLLYQEGEIAPLQRYKMSEIIRSLRIINVANSSIDNIYIYYFHHDFVLTDEMKYDFDDFVLWELEYANIDEVKSYLQNRQPGKFSYFAGTGKEDPFETQPDLYFMKTLPLASPWAPLGVIAIRVNSDAILDAMTNAKVSPNSIVRIVDANDAVILTTAGSDTGIAAPPESTDVFYVSIYSKVNSWRYDFYVPMDDVLGGIRRFRMFTLYGVSTCLFLALIFSYIFARSNYGHIHSILAKLKGKESSKPEPGWNEYALIERSIDRIIDENKRTQSLLLKQSDGYKKAFLSRLLKGNLNTTRQETIDLARSYDIELGTRDFAVILVYFDDSYRPLSNEFRLHSDIDFELIGTVLLEITREMNRDGFMHHIADVERSLTVFVTCVQENHVVMRQHLANLAENIIEMIGRKLEVIPATAISAIHSRVTEVSQAYKETIEVVEHSALAPSAVQYYDEISSVTKSIYSYSLEDKVKLINCICSEDYESAKSIFDVAVDHIISRFSFNSSLLRVKLLGLLNLVTDAVEEITFFSDEDIFGAMNPLQELLSCRNIAEIKRTIDTAFEMIATSATGGMSLRENGIEDAVLDILKKEYNNPELSVGSIAEKLGLNPSYLSRIFKVRCDCGLLDYIHRYRINMAKKIMRETSQPVKVIARQVGWINYITFSRVFKKQEGVTPGVYKRLSL